MLQNQDKSDEVSPVIFHELAKPLNQALKTDLKAIKRLGTNCMSAKVLQFRWIFKKNEGIFSKTIIH